jgi:hypothetical protein
MVCYLNSWEELRELVKREIVYEVLEVRVYEKKDFTILALDNIRDRKIIISGYFNFLCLTGEISKIEGEEIVYTSSKTSVIKGNIERINFVYISV